MGIISCAVAAWGCAVAGKDAIIGGGAVNGRDTVAGGGGVIGGGGDVVAVRGTVASGGIGRSIVRYRLNVCEDLCRLNPSSGKSLIRIQEYVSKLDIKIVIEEVFYHRNTYRFLTRSVFRRCSPFSMLRCCRHLNVEQSSSNVNLCEDITCGSRCMGVCSCCTNTRRDAAKVSSFAFLRRTRLSARYSLTIAAGSTLG